MEEYSLKEITRKSQIIYKGKLVNLRLEEVLLPDERIASREIIEHPGSVVIIPLLENNKIVVIKQFRKPVEQVLYELPAGKLEKGEDIAKCAERELLEETGYKAKEMIKLSSFYTTPGFSDELMHLFLAKGLILNQQQLNQNEFLEVNIFSLAELIKMVIENKIRDAKSIIGLFWAKFLF